MSFAATVERDDLLKKLAIGQRVVERRTTIPILSNALLRLADNRLHIRATDLDIQASLSLPAQIRTPGEITIPAHTFHDIVRKLPDGAQIVLDGETKPGTLVIKSGRSRFTLQTLEAHDFPELGAGELPCRFEIGATALADMIARSNFAISTEETRYYLNGIFLHAVEHEGGTVLRAVATDGHRLARVDHAGVTGIENMPGVIVPKKTVDQIARLLPGLAEPVAIELSASKIRITLPDGTEIVSKLIDGTFPDYSRVVPEPNGTSVFTAKTADLVSAIDRVSTISSERGRAVRFAFAPDGLTASVTNPDAGTSEDMAEGELSGEPLEIGFNGRYMLDILGAHGGENTRIDMRTAGDAARISAGGESHALFVLMPMRV